MNYVPRLKEEEALILILRSLAVERKGQATVRELKLSIEESKLRPWSAEDSSSNLERSGAPMWHQIIQNASDRLEDDRHFYRSIFVKVISGSPHKVLQISDAGRRFVTDLNVFEERLLGDGFHLYQYLDSSPLDDGDAWNRISKALKSVNARYEAGNEKADLLRSLRSLEYALKNHENYETAGVHQKIIEGLRSIHVSEKAGSVDSWNIARNYVGGLANLETKRELALSQFFGSLK